MYWVVSIIVAILFSVSAASGMGDAAKNKVKKKAKDKSAKQAVLDETERFEQVYQLNPDGEVSASNISGNIKVTTWESPQVRLVAIKSAENPERLKDMELKIDSSPTRFSVKVKYRSEKSDDGYWDDRGRMSVEYELTVPRSAVLDKITSVSGNVDVDGAGNSTRASSVSGNVSGKNLGGTAKLSSVSGTVTADFSNVEPGSNIKMNSVSGNVVLNLPSYAGATVRASTVTGKISNDFGLKVNEGKYVGANLKGTFGDGSVDVKLSTVSGQIKIGRDGNP